MRTPSSARLGACGTPVGRSDESVVKVEKPPRIGHQFKLRGAGTGTPTAVREPAMGFWPLNYSTVEARLLPAQDDCKGSSTVVRASRTLSLNQPILLVGTT